jgi:hypothetical protein
MYGIATAGASSPENSVPAESMSERSSSAGAAEAIIGVAADKAAVLESTFALNVERLPAPF